MFLQDLGDRLRARRAHRRLTQTDIANALQVSPQAVSKWERGENAPDITLLASLARVLGVTTDWILGNHAADGDELDATVFVSSINGFTARCETLTPDEIVVWCNGFFHQVTEAVLQHGGVPVKYMGDAFLAFFAGDDRRARAIAAAVTAREIVTDPIVIGLATGPAYFAAVGHTTYARPDILGPTVNRAFRVNGWAAANAQTHIAAEIADDPNLTARFRLGEPVVAELKGLADPLHVREVFGRTDS